MTTVDYSAYGNAGKLLTRAQEWGIPVKKHPNREPIAGIMVEAWTIGNGYESSPHDLLVFHTPSSNRQRHSPGISTVRLYRRWGTHGHKRVTDPKITMGQAFVYLGIFREERERMLARIAEGLLSA